MYVLYEKVPKSEEYPNGIKRIEPDTNPFESGPCLISLVALAGNVSHANGALNRGLEALRLQTSKNVNTGISMEDIDCRVFSLLYDEPNEVGTTKHFEPTPEGDFEFAEKYILPLITKDGQKIDTSEAMKKLRNINFLTYCNATRIPYRMEQYLKEKMGELSYSDEEIANILSQVCVIGYGTETKVKNLKEGITFDSTNISVIDCNDQEVGDCYNPRGFKDALAERKIIYFKKENVCFVNASGIHSTDSYIMKDPHLSSLIASFVTSAVENSIVNSKSDTFVPLSYSFLLDSTKTIRDGIHQGNDRNELMSIVDSKTQRLKLISDIKKTVAEINELGVQIAAAREENKEK